MSRPTAAILADLVANSAVRAKLEAELYESLRAVAAAPERPAVASTRYLTTREAAELLGVSTRTLARWREQGVGPTFVRIRGCVRYSYDGAVVGRVETPKREH